MPRASRVTTHRADAALIIFAKAPIPWQVKTRLCPPLTPDEAASLHGSFVLDALERSKFDLQRASSGRESRNSNLFDRFLACDPSGSHVFFKIMEERQGVRLIDQVGADLGTRMEQASAAAFAMGYRFVLIVGTDLPTLQPTVYMQALELLAAHDLVLGPAKDGGYYLVGLTRPVPDLFVGIPWSTDQVLALTRQKAATLGLSTALLPECRDVDTIADILALIEEENLDCGKVTPLASRLSKRTAGALRLIAERLKQRNV